MSKITVDRCSQFAFAFTGPRFFLVGATMAALQCGCTNLDAKSQSDSDWPNYGSSSGAIMASEDEA